MKSYLSRMILNFFVCTLVLMVSEHAYAQYAFDDPGSQSEKSEAGSLIAVNESIDAGALNVGSVAQVVVLFRNESSKPIESGNIELFPSSNVMAEVDMNECTVGAITPGAECPVAITVKALQLGTWRVDLLMQHDGRSKWVAANLKGKVEKATVDEDSGSNRDVEVSPNEITFPTMATSRAVVKSLLLRNITSESITINDIVIDTGDEAGFVLSDNCDFLESGQSCVATITWTPISEGLAAGVVLVNHSGSSRNLSVPITGEYSPDDVGLEVTPESVDFGDLSSSQTMVRSVVLKNITSKPIDIEDITLNSNPNSGLELDGECNGLRAGEACLLTIKWSPLQSGSVTGVLNVKHDGPTGVSSVVIDGKYSPEDAVVAKMFPQAVPGRGLLVASEEEVNFESGITAESSITVSLVNSGDASLTINDIEITGRDHGLSIEPGSCSDEMILEPMQACPLTILWSPSRKGDLVEDLKISHTGARGILVIPIRGSADEAVSMDSKTVSLNNSPGLSLGLDNSLLDENDSRIKSLMSDDILSVDIEYLIERAKIKKAALSAGKNGQTGNIGDKLPELDYDEIPSSALPVPKNFQQNLSAALQGYTITSLARDRAIVTGPKGARAVFDDEDSILGGVVWRVNVKNSGIEFKSGSEKILMLFDRSLAVSSSSVSSTDE